MIILRQANFSIRNKIGFLNKLGHAKKNSFSKKNIKTGVKNIVNNIRSEVNSFAIDPGESAARLGSTLSYRPALALSSPIPVPGSGILIDEGLKKVSPKYVKISERSRELYDKKARKHVKSAAGALSNYVNLYYT